MAAKKARATYTFSTTPGLIKKLESVKEALGIGVSEQIRRGVGLWLAQAAKLQAALGPTEPAKKPKRHRGPRSSPAKAAAQSVWLGGSPVAARAFAKKGSR